MGKQSLKQIIAEMFDPSEALKGLEDLEARRKANEVARRLTGRDPHRQSGRTTRIVDAAIQELFLKGEVTIQDHFHPEGTKLAFRILTKRMDTEHPRVSWNKTGPFTIKLKYFGI